ncbi:MAG: SEC-C domain-containing protein, partial [Akkermansiaceae bacterium]|nr:SEC-C domain-containing protein [Akkermansiaceae bacterium]
LHLEGEVAEALEEAIRAGRMGTEREGTAIVLGWLDYERRGMPPPPDFQALARKACREVSRMRQPIVRILLEPASALAGDPLIAGILGTEAVDEADRKMVLKRLRATTTGPDWDRSIPATIDADLVLGAGATVTRAVPKAGRNDPCPCGSGRKFKQCCAGKLTTAEQYAVDGVAIATAKAHPELILNEQRIDQLRSYELFTLDPKQIPKPLAGYVALRLAMFREIPRAIEVLETAGLEAMIPFDLEEIAYELYAARDAAALRRLFSWAPGQVESCLEFDLLLATPAERWQMLCAKAHAAATAPADSPGLRLALADLATGALLADPALGIQIARGVLPGCVGLNQDMIVEDIEDACDLLGIADDNPGFGVIDDMERSERDHARHQHDLKKIVEESSAQVARRDTELKQLKHRIETLRQDLVKREAALARKAAAAPPPSAAPAVTPAAPAAEPAEVRELRDELRRLKDNLKVEHEELNQTTRDLRAARDQMRRMNSRARQELGEDTSMGGVGGGTDAAGVESDDDEAGAPAEWQKQPVRVPEYGSAFRAALRRFPRQATAAALVMAGRLAGGDPSAWHTVRSLRLRPGVLRARVAGDYRLLFETGPGESLRLVDFILRRDLEKWLGGGEK